MLDILDAAAVFGNVPADTGASSAACLSAALGQL
jgi:hypothetical protein